MLKTIATLSFMMLCSGCMSFPRTSRDIVPEQEAVNTVTLNLDANYAGEDGLLPRLVYVFPPLKIGRDGIPVEEYYYTVDQKGHLIWHAPAPQAAPLRQEVLERFRYLGFTPVSFYELSGNTKDHAVLVVTLYYSDPWISQKNIPVPDGTEEYALFTRLSGATFPRDLSAEGKTEKFNQETLAVFPNIDLVFPVIEQSFRYSVKHIGKNKRSLEIAPVTASSFTNRTKWLEKMIPRG